MKNLFNSLCEQKRRSLTVSACCLLVLFSVSFLSVTSTRSYGQWLGSVSNSLTCSSDPYGTCFTLTFLSGNVTVHSLVLDFSNLTCWSYSCFSGQFPVTLTNAGNTGIKAYIESTSPLTIQFSTNGGTTWIDMPIGATLTMLLCTDPSGDCSDNGTLSWTASNAGGTTGTGFIGFASGGGTWCPTCDYTDLMPSAYYDGYCYDRACYTEHSGGSSSGPFRITFDPAYPGNSGCPQPQYLYTYTDEGGTVHYGNTCDQTDHLEGLVGPEGWTIGSLVTSGSTNYATITPPSGTTISSCDGFCIYIPMCSTVRKMTVTIQDEQSGAPSPCSPAPSMSFKRSFPNTNGNTSGENTSSGGNNFPNPVTSASDFRTTVPFTLAADGDARISFFNDAGKLVYTETNSFVGSGAHFFYFTARDLPSGSYYYNIESPLDVTIVKKTILVVK
jgi:hypothetical protein